jgi:hypothetical protein
MNLLAYYHFDVRRRMRKMEYPKNMKDVLVLVKNSDKKVSIFLLKDGSFFYIVPKEGDIATYTIDYVGEDIFLAKGRCQNRYFNINAVCYVDPLCWEVEKA